MNLTQDIVKALRASGQMALAQQVEDGAVPEVLQLHANVRIELRGPDGRIKEEREFHNLICTVGKNLLLASGGTAQYIKQFSYIAIGTGTNAAAIGDTTLQTEAARNISTVSNPTAASLQFTYTFPAGTGTGAITESGLLDATSSGNLLARQVFSVVNKGASDTLAVTWTLT